MCVCVCFVLKIKALIGTPPERIFYSDFMSFIENAVLGNISTSASQVTFVVVVEYSTRRAYRSNVESVQLPPH